jgi:hypothetical protein
MNLSDKEFLRLLASYASYLIKESKTPKIQGFELNNLFVKHFVLNDFTVAKSSLSAQRQSNKSQRIKS